MKCLNRNTLEYLVLEEVSGIHGFELESTVRHYLNKYGRYPELDEIPGANSEPHLLKVLEVKERSGIKHLKVQNIMEFTGAETLEEAIATINNKYKDLETKIIQVGEDAVINITKRPSEYGFIEKNIEIVNTKNINSPAVIQKSLNKLRTLYGINLIPITSAELNSEKWQGVIPEATTTSAFVYQGDIYVNTDIANVEAPTHELLHIFLGAMRFSDNAMYVGLLSHVADSPLINQLSQIYSNRTNQDLLEEVFITEYAKYLTGQESAIDSLDESVISKINYYIRRNLDSVLMGEYSVKALDMNKVANASLVDLAQEVRSEITNTVLPTFMNVASMSHRLANTKSALMKDSKLEEHCV